MYLLDTNVIVVFLQGLHRPLLERFEGVPASQKYICSVVAGELLYGVSKSQRYQKNLARVNALLDYLPFIPFDLDAARHFGEIRAHLQRQGTPIGPYDLQIAAIARSRNLTLVTHNTREFERVPDLRLEDWQSEFFG